MAYVTHELLLQDMIDSPASSSSSLHAPCSDCQHLVKPCHRDTNDSAGASGQVWTTPEPLSSSLSDDLAALYSSPTPSAPGGSLQRQESDELLPSLLPELFSWADSLSALQTSESLASPSSLLSEDSSLLPHTRGEHGIGEGLAPACYVLLGFGGSS